ncbi:hypothetical protein Dvina_38505 [Dactylosporangium vinaceum]|uniref:Uncharacterized protein n=1 Tax=Dactylosporangium vinaceum TaxID=53362 RepID=A0ABV5MLZ0_9ACTN|nr:hypothetical protein [Dactylosporangium vinaceum]UAB94041.1 hypothetical protein Dvina_38505 [Dactylosporangium vinaceum]
MSDGGAGLLKVFTILRSAAVATVVIALAAACSDEPAPQTAPSAGVTSTQPAPALSPATPSASAAASPSGYTKPPSRNLTRPAGVAPISGSTCTYAQGDIHIFAASWASNQVKWVQRGQKVPDDTWAETVSVTEGYHGGIATTRSRLKDAKVPESFVVYSDLADADAAISEAVAAAKAKDDSKVLAVYAKARTAEDHLTESCSALQ